MLRCQSTILKVIIKRNNYTLETTVARHSLHDYAFEYHMKTEYKILGNKAPDGGNATYDSAGGKGGLYGKIWVETLGPDKDTLSYKSEAWYGYTFENNHSHGKPGKGFPHGKDRIFSYIQKYTRFTDNEFSAKYEDIQQIDNGSSKDGIVEGDPPERGPEDPIKSNLFSEAIFNYYIYQILHPDYNRLDDNEKHFCENLMQFMMDKIGTKDFEHEPMQFINEFEDLDSKIGEWKFITTDEKLDLYELVLQRVNKWGENSKESVNSQKLMNAWAVLTSHILAERANNSHVKLTLMNWEVWLKYRFHIFWYIQLNSQQTRTSS